MLTFLSEAINNDDDEVTKIQIPVESASDGLTWIHKAMLIGVLLAAIVAFLRYNGTHSEDDWKTKV